MAKDVLKENVPYARMAAGIEYDGASYYGWQRQEQPAMSSVQEQVEKAFSYVANHSVSVVCAGRTDSGVHATGQVIHFDAAVTRSQKSWVCGANSNLPDDVVVKWVREVPSDFHARFSATARTYRYIILNNNIRSAILHRRATLIERKLDIVLMQQAANHLLGELDFSAYRGAGCQSKSAFRCVNYIRVSTQGDLVVTEISANAFLLHMVRNIMGVLIKIGLGEKPAIWSKEVLDSRDRKQAAKTAPPYGLYLVQAHYPLHFGLPVTSMGPAFIREEGDQDCRQ